jgi:alpha-ketoglutarate-dependent taurine dioxygenase
MLAALSTKDLAATMAATIASLTSDLLLVADADFDPHSLPSLLEGTSLEILSNSEGAISVVRDDHDLTDFSRHGMNFDFHTDGLYYDVVPQFVILHCVDPGIGAAQTLFADTRRAARVIAEDPALSILRDCELVYISRSGDEHPHSLLARHSESAEPVMRAAARGFLRPRVNEQGLPRLCSLREFVRAQERLFRLLDDSVVVRHSWRKGQIAVFDNQTFVHARQSSRGDPSRRLHRIWISRKREASNVGALVQPGRLAD